MDHAAYWQMYRGIIDGQERHGRKWIMQHAGRCKEVGLEMDCACIMPADVQWQAGDGLCVHHARRCTVAGRRWIMQHAGRWTEAWQEKVQAVGGKIDNWERQLMHQTAGWQKDRKKAGQEMMYVVQAQGGQIDSKGRQMKLHGTGVAGGS
jgi:hypothetical protein